MFFLILNVYAYAVVGTLVWLVFEAVFMGPKSK